MATAEPGRAPDQPRTYGNWRRPRTAGIAGLGMIGTGALLSLFVLCIVVMAAAGVLWAIAVAVVGLGALSTILIRDRHGRSWLQALALRIGWARTRLVGGHLYRSGPIGRTPSATCALPGLAASTQLSEHRDAWDRPFALIHLRSVGHYAIVFAADPDGASLVDAEQEDQWVAHWGHWLAAIADEPGIVAAAVTIETAPDTGARLGREVAGNLSPDAPALAREVLTEIVASYPEGSATVKATIALTFSGSGRGFARARDRDEMARDLGSRLPWLGESLRETGAGAVRPMGAQELSEHIRTAYEPRAAEHFERARAHGAPAAIGWEDVGPMAAEAGWDTYRHDGAFSTTWAMTQAPRGEVSSSVLARLLRPHPDVERKRVTLLYRPIDSATAAAIVEADRRNADFRASGKRPSARAIVEQRSAQAIAAEEARGAGLVSFGMLVTATATSRERLAGARQAIEHLGPTARIMLRPVYGSQDAAFAAALPLGLALRAHLRVPSGIKDAL